MEQSPTVARWELSRLLANRRAELGLDVKTITDHLGFTRNYWSAIENDRTLIASDKLKLLFDLMEFDEDTKKKIVELRAVAKKRAWWDTHPALRENELIQRLCGLEAGATQIRTYDSLNIPGLLQTDEYAKAAIGGDPVVSPVEVASLLDVRQRRQAVLTEDDGPELVALVSEAALMQQIAGPEVQRRQLQHLVRFTSEHDSVEVRVMPFAINPGGIVHASTLVLLDFETMPRLAFQEALRPLGIVDQVDDEFRRLDLAWSEGLNRSLDVEASLNLIKHAAGNSQI